jgi:hypothetical protein
MKNLDVLSILGAAAASLLTGAYLGVGQEGVSHATASSAMLAGGNRDDAVRFASLEPEARAPVAPQVMERDVVAEMRREARQLALEEEAQDRSAQGQRDSQPQARPAQESRDAEHGGDSTPRDRAAQDASSRSRTQESVDPANRAAVDRLIAAERTHREQLARINRLKEIAERKGQRERVTELDRLLARSNTSFDGKLKTAQAELPAPAYASTIQMLQQGRRSGVKEMMGGAGQPPTQSSSERAKPAPSEPGSEPAHPEREPKPAPERAKPAPERPKPAPERPAPEPERPKPEPPH